MSGEVHTTGQIASPLGQYNPGDLTVLEVSVVGKDAASYGKPIGRMMMQASGILEQDHAIYSTEIYSFGEIALGELFGLAEAKSFMEH